MALQRRLLLGAGAALLIGAGRAQTPPFPNRPVTLMVPWPAGAPSDAIARRLQPLFQQALGQPLLVDNLGGAGGTLGVGKALQQAADGHTVLVGTPTELVLSPLTIPGVRYKAEDVALIGHFGRVPCVLCGRPNLPPTTLAELLASQGFEGFDIDALGGLLGRRNAGRSPAAPARGVGGGRARRRLSGLAAQHRQRPLPPAGPGRLPGRLPARDRALHRPAARLS